MDGVVVDTAGTVASFWQWLAESERCTISDEDMDDHVYGRRAEHTLRTLFKTIPEERYPEVYESLRIREQTLRYSEIPGAVALVRQLSAADVAIALVTGAQHWKAEAVLEQLGLVEVFPVQIRAEDVTAGKPDPSCYRMAAERLDVDIARCLVFEDAASGVTAAVAAGASCVALATGARAEEMLQLGADAVVRDFHDVAFSNSEKLLRLRSGAEYRFPGNSSAKGTGLEFRDDR
jgi:HAD superfamily hydrolase (TIGR01509 family)